MGKIVAWAFPNHLVLYNDTSRGNYELNRFITYFRANDGINVWLDDYYTDGAGLWEKPIGRGVYTDTEGKVLLGLKYADIHAMKEAMWDWNIHNR